MTDICNCERSTVPHVHIPMTNDRGVPIGAVWDEPEAPETRDEEIERRLHACEANLSNIWERLNAGSADHS